MPIKLPAASLRRKLKRVIAAAARVVSISCRASARCLVARKKQTLAFFAPTPIGLGHGNLPLKMRSKLINDGLGTLSEFLSN
jgi:hypothetical protein